MDQGRKKGEEGWAKETGKERREKEDGEQPRSAKGWRREMTARMSS